MVLRKGPKTGAVTAESGGIQQLYRPPSGPDLDALARLLEPAIGPWPGAVVRPEGPAATLEATLAIFIGAALEDEEGLDLVGAHDEGTGVTLTVRNGRVQVLEVPLFIFPHLVHALPLLERPQDVLGSVVRIRSVSQAGRPAPGLAWYVVAKVDGTSRLRLWRVTSGPLEDAAWLDGATADQVAATLDAFVAAWNDAMASGWAAWSQLATVDFADVASNVSPALAVVPFAAPDWKAKATDALVSRLVPNPHHPMWADRTTGGYGRLLVVDCPTKDGKPYRLTESPREALDFGPGRGRTLRVVRVEDEPEAGRFWLEPRAWGWRVFKIGAALPASTPTPEATPAPTPKATTPESALAASATPAKAPDVATRIRAALERERIRPSGVGWERDGAPVSDAELEATVRPHVPDVHSLGPALEVVRALWKPTVTRGAA